MKKKTNNQIRGEAEICRYLQPIVDKCYQPLLRQLRLNKTPQVSLNPHDEIKGGFDILGLEWLSFSIKFDGRNRYKEWWPELLEKTESDQEPVLFYRTKQTEWFAVMKMYSDIDEKRFFAFAHVPLHHFLIYFEYRLKLELKEKVKGMDILHRFNNMRPNK